MLAFLSVGALCGEARAQDEPPPRTATTAPSRTEFETQRAELIEQRAQLEALAQRLRDMEEVQLMPSEPEEDPAAQKISFYGFFETGAQRTWMKEHALFYGLQQTPAWSFILGSLNLYLDAKPAPGWRALFEVRVSTSHGATAPSTGGIGLVNRTERRINEPGIGTGGTQLQSSLILERAQIEYEYDDWLGARIGLWLTPQGIWNVDHGSPTLIPLIAPYFITLQTFPTHQLGLALFGRTRLGGWHLGYHLALSNGRISGPTTVNNAYWPSFDITDDKMVSGRLQLSPGGRSTLRLGLSGYWGTSSQDERQVVQINPVRVYPDVAIELQESGIGADISWDPWRLRLRAEFLYNVIRYPGIRPASNLFPTQLEADSAQYAGYFLVSAPLDVWAITVEPYVYAEVLWQPTTIAPLVAGGMASWGVNLDVVANVRIKLQYGFQFFIDDHDGLKYSSADSVHLFSSRVVVSF